MYLQESKNLKQRVQAMMPARTIIVAKKTAREEDATIEVKRQFEIMDETDRQAIKDLISLNEKLKGTISMRKYWIRMEVKQYLKGEACN